MNRKTLSLLCGALCFSSCGYPGPATFSGPATFDDIAEVIINYQLISQRPLSERGRLIYFLSVNNREDPSSVLLERLNKKGFPFRPISQSLWKDGKLRDKASGGIGLWLSASDVECPSSNYCRAKGQIQTDRDGLHGWEYQLLRKNGKWKVKNIELYLVS